jgi:DUF4097 and DUF4098 domain-containing protein YvlB
MMRLLMRGTLLVVATLLMSVMGAVAFAQSVVREEFHQTYPLAADGRVTLENINGAVRINAWDRNEVKVDAVKWAYTRERVDEAKIQIDSTPASIRIETEYPERSQTFTDDARGRINNPATVEYTLTVPRNARLESIELINGALDIEGVTGDVKASSINGQVTARGLTGEARLSTINGQLQATFNKLEELKPISLSSVNGGVMLIIPSDANATIKASTVHGGISNNFGLPVRRGDYVGHDLMGQLGSGSTRIKLGNVNGGIQIRRASDNRQPSPVVNLLSSAGKDKDADDDRDWDDDEAKDAVREAARAAREAQREAQRATREAQREVERATREAEQAQREAAQAAREAQREAQEAQREARQAQAEAQREAQAAQAEARRAAQAAQTDGQREAEQARLEAARAAQEAQREAQEAQREAQRAVEEARREAARAQAEGRQEAARAQLEAQREAARAQREAQRAVRDSQREVQRAVREAQVEAARAAREAAGEVRNEPGYMRLVERETLNFKVSGGTARVHLETFDGTINVRAWDQPEVRVTLVKRASDEQMMKGIRLQGDQRGGEIFIKADFDKAFARREGNSNFVSANANLELLVPRKTILRASTGDGRVDIEGIDGEVNANTGDGPVDVRDGRGRLTINTGDGRIRVTNFNGTLDARTGDGGLLLEGRFNHLTVNTGDGSISLGLPADLNATIETNAEGITNEGLTVTEENTASKHLRRWRVGGGGPLFTLRTGAGRIILRRADNLR